MKTRFALFLTGLMLITINSCSQEKNMNYNKLTLEEEYVILQKGTEKPFTGKYEKFDSVGTFICKRCNAPLYRSQDKFDAKCGWPSFDDEIPGAIKRIPDADGMRTEIECAKCGAHLGHVFAGERFTPKNTRHCVNSISLNFVPFEVMKNEKAIFAGGCFWGVEYYMQKAKGVISARVGYIGGQTKNPSYKEVCTHTTGHAEAVEITFDPSKTSFEDLAKLFFEIHDPTQVDRQGPDVGDQYRSEIFYLNDEQKATSEKLIKILEEKGYNVATKLTKATEFYEAEDYHQDYYDHKGSLPYCHGYVKRF
jgi:peptide methionine sulfoxide reductase msrA/msrB